ncbi:PspC domain-containing protein [Lacinutrix sp. C3R15]|uniref:PspC domain-containing protein n=1 Tax=Flavobacteriaceae TaxID=49546 RepID=UPI001C080819|nr:MULTISPECIES: PspC domain-containing protein [Flavobacteriaceae]MBU2940772.1 PspC domain-containing protein [Lacinutrix sp. C3R15]MDO6624090.1 PspC domain-containing protein [Oceanihabitans sp. 1_MG-2023]
MNKTVNINLAGIFFHIDEDAYLKLQRYLEAIKRSFTDSQGRSEIISDIEARIAELFTERVKHDKQVIGIKEVDDVITIMGQPEDYIVDDEIFDDEPKQYTNNKTASRKLFRDTDNSYVGGVSAGLAHYFGIDAIWIRLIWILLIFGAGTGVLLYILLWILLPEAVTTSDKLMMKGEPVNISNIEKKIKDGITTVTDTVQDVAKNVSDSVSDAAKNVDFKKKSNSLKSTSTSFFDTIGNLFMFLLKIVAKCIGVFLIFIGASTLIGLVIAMFTVGISDAINVPGFDLVDTANAAGTPVWLVSLLALFAIGIPFFFIFYLGLKILINNLKSIGNIAKYSLLGLWFVSIIGLIIIGITQATEHAFDATVNEKMEYSITTNDTLSIKRIDNNAYNKSMHKNGNSFQLVYGDNDEKHIYSSDIELIIKSTEDSLVSLHVEKTADGRSFQSAKERAENINYNYTIVNNTVELDKYLTTNATNKFSDQEVSLILYVPEDMVIHLNKNTRSFLNRYRSNNNLVTYKDAGQFLKIKNEEAICLDCTQEETEEDYKVKINVNDEKGSININNDGLEIKTEDSNVKINKNGVRANTNEVKVHIDEDGIQINQDEE